MSLLSTFPSIQTILMVWILTIFDPAEETGRVRHNFVP
jgi:hypothetical protein